MRRVACALGLTIIVAACSQGSSKELPSFSSKDLERNAQSISKLVARQCFEAAGDRNEFQKRLERDASEWKLVQEIDPEDRLTLDLWKAGGIQIFRGEITKDEIWTCSVAIDRSASPTLQNMIVGLSSVSGQSPTSDATWQWKQSPLRYMIMDVGPSGDPPGGLFIHVEVYRLPWWRAFLG